MATKWQQKPQGSTGLSRNQANPDCANSGQKPDSGRLHRKAAQSYETEGHRFESCRAR